MAREKSTVRCGVENREASFLTQHGIVLIQQRAWDGHATRLHVVLL